MTLEQCSLNFVIPSDDVYDHSQLEVLCERIIYGQRSRARGAVLSGI